MKRNKISNNVLLGIFIPALAGLLFTLHGRALALQPEDLTGHDAGARREASENNTPDPPGAKITEPEEIARVNGEPVTRAELQRMLTDPLMKRRFRQELGIQEPEGKEFERLAVRELIHRRLLLQEADRRHLTVTEEEFDQALSAFRRRFEDLTVFGMWMQERGLDDNSLFATIRTEMLTSRVRKALTEGVRHTEEQVREYYDTHKEDLTIGDEVRLRIIVVKDKAAAEEIMTALRQGENFSELARERSLGKRAAQGGDTGWTNARTLPPLLQGAVGTLKAGDLVGPLRKGSDEFFIVGLEGRRPMRAKNLAEARPEIEQRLLSAKRQEVIMAWLTAQEKQSKIEIFPRPE